MNRSKLHRTALAAALVSLGFSMGAYAQGAGTPASPSGGYGTPAQPPATRPAPPARSDMQKSDSLARADRKFVEEAAMGGMAEVELGRLAQQKAQSAEVRQFGETMVQDHGKANDELKQLASAKGVELPTSLDRKRRRVVDKLSKASGAEFDREYMKETVSEHKDDVSDFEKAAKSSKDPQVQSFASKTLPTLEDHLKTAQSTQNAVKSAKR